MWVEAQTQRHFSSQVICLTARDEFLTERMMQITHQAAHNTPADFQRRLDAFKAAAKSNGGVAAWLESVVTNAEEGREVLVRAIAADAAPLLPPPPPASPLDEPPGDVVLAEAIEFVGVPHNYGPTPQEIEAAHLQELQKEQVAWGWDTCCLRRLFSCRGKSPIIHTNNGWKGLFLKTASKKGVDD